MSSLRLALKMSIEDSRTPETKPKPHKGATSSSSSSSSSGTGKQKRKRESQNSDEKNFKSTKLGDEEVESDAETEDSLKINSDHEEIVNKGKPVSENRKKKSSPPPDKSIEKVIDPYDGVDLLIASRQTPPIGTQTTSANSTAKKASKERPKTPVMMKPTKRERNVTPIIPSPSPEPESHVEVEIQRPIPTFISQPAEETKTTPEPIKIEAVETQLVTVEVEVTHSVIEPEKILCEPDVSEAAAAVPLALEVPAHPQEAESKEPERERVESDNKDLSDKIASSKKATNKKKRKGGLDLAEAEEILGAAPIDQPEKVQPEKVEEPGESEAPDNPRIPSRAAAMAAKSKIHTSKPKPAPEGEIKKVEEPPPHPQVAPILEAPSLGTVLKAQWVACDKCGKWRRIPGDIDLSTLPEQWFCTMNM
jgi:hypothetical protein